MSSYSDSRPARKRPRFTLQATFPSNEERDAFSRRFEAVCKLLQPVGEPPLDNHGLLCTMFDAMERSTRQDSSVARGGALGARAPPLARVTCILDSIIWSQHRTTIYILL